MLQVTMEMKVVANFWFFKKVLIAILLVVNFWFYIYYPSEPENRPSPALPKMCSLSKIASSRLRESQIALRSPMRGWKRTQHKAADQLRTISLLKQYLGQLQGPGLYYTAQLYTALSYVYPTGRIPDSQLVEKTMSGRWKSWDVLPRTE